MPRQIVQLITPASNQSPAKVSEKQADLPLGISTEVHDLIFSKVLTVDTVSETRLLSGLQQDMQADLLSKAITALKESIETHALKPYQPQVAPHGSPLAMHYLPASDKLLLNSGASLRLLSRDSQTHDFPMSHLSFTGVTPSSPTADVRLNLNLKSLSYLLTTLDW